MHMYAPWESGFRIITTLHVKRRSTAFVHNQPRRYAGAVNGLGFGRTYCGASAEHHNRLTYVCMGHTNAISRDALR
jgi:hypothetical protein